MSRGLANRLAAEAKRNASTPIAVSLTGRLALPTEIKQLPLAEFYDVLGGEVRTDRVFVADLHRVMDELGHNKLPKGLTGRPDDLLEAYVADCLQFLLECPVRRFGHERRFERLPDGIALGRSNLNVCFDTKAYGEQFHPQADDIRRFASYVRDFNQRYQGYIGHISTFLVVSGALSGDIKAVKEKANDLIVECATPLVLIKAAHLAEAVQMVRPLPRHRAAINWRSVFVPEVFAPSRLAKELSRIRKDSVIS